MPLASWHGHIFEVTQKTILSFEDLMFKAGCDTEDKTSGTDKWEALKTSDPVNVSMTVNLRSYFGVDVRKTAEGLMNDARTGEKDYFYLGGTKLFGCLLMLKQAEISETKVGQDGFLREAKCALSLVQCEKWGGGTGTGGGGTGGTGTGTKKASVKKQNPKEEGSSITKTEAEKKKLGPTDWLAKQAQAALEQSKKKQQVAATISKVTTQTKDAKQKSYSKSGGGPTGGNTTPQPGKIKYSTK